MNEKWRGWAIWCLAAPIAGVLLVLTAIPALAGLCIEEFRKR